MASTSVRIAIEQAVRSGRYSAVALGDHPKMTLVGDGGIRVTIPYAPLPVDHSDLARKWDELGRDLREPVLLPGAQPLRKQTFTLTLARPSHQSPVEDYIRSLRDAAASDQRFAVSYGPLEAGLWRITDLSVTVTHRQHGTNLATRATARLTLTAAGPSIRVGPLTGGVVTQPVAPPARRTYRVVRGDTLWALAVRFYGNGRRWPEIARANGIADPRKMPTYQQSGKELVIP